MTWERGRAAIEAQLASGELEVVTASDELGQRLLVEATAHLVSARTISESDPAGAYQLAYDAARKACSALLAVQGLRATTRGGHIAVQEAVRDQFGGEGGVAAFRAFPRLRRTRAGAEYPRLDTPTVTEADASDAIEAANAIFTVATGLLGSGKLTPFQVHRPN